LLIYIGTQVVDIYRNTSCWYI